MPARRAAALGSLLFAAGAASASEVVHSNLEEYSAPAFDTTDVTFSFLFKCQANQDCWHHSTGGTWRQADHTMAAAQAGMQGEATYSGFNRDYFRRSLTSAISWASAEYSSPFQINHFSGIELDRVVEQTGALSSEFTSYNGHWNVMVRATVRDVPAAVANDFMPVVTRMFGANVGTGGASPGYSPDKAVMHWDSVWISSPTYSYFLDDKLEPVVGRGHKGQRLLIPLLLGITAMLLVPMMAVACTVSQQEAVVAAEKVFGKEDAKYERVSRDVAEKEAVVSQHQKKEKEDRDTDKKRAQEAADRHAQELEMVDVDWLREDQPPGKAPVRQAAPPAKQKASKPPQPVAEPWTPPSAPAAEPAAQTLFTPQPKGSPIGPAAPPPTPVQQDPPPVARRPRPEGKASCGLKLEDKDDADPDHAEGLVVHTVRPGEPADKAGVKVHDVLLSARNITAGEYGEGGWETPINDQVDFRTFLDEGRPEDVVLFKVRRGSADPEFIRLVLGRRGEKAPATDAAGEGLKASPRASREFRKAIVDGQQADDGKWEAVHPFWKTPDGKMFNRKRLKECFPCEPTEEQKKYRRALFQQWDMTGTGRISFMEFDTAFNMYTTKKLKESGVKVSGGKSSIFMYVRKSLYYAFDLANDTHKLSLSKRGRDIDAGGDYITKPEMRMLMCATQSALLIYRLFDVADKDKDKRVSRTEWDRAMPEINAILRGLDETSLEGSLKIRTVYAEDFREIDKDGQGSILLGEAVKWFLDMVCNEPTLIAESEEGS